MFFFIIFFALSLSYQQLITAKAVDLPKKACQAQKNIKNIQQKTIASQKTIQPMKKIAQTDKPIQNKEKKRDLASISSAAKTELVKKEVTITDKPAIQNREIIVSNGITSAMQAKRYLGYDYQPDSFSIQINKEQMKEQEERKVALQNNRLLVEYNYNFKNSYIGTRVVEFEIPESVKECTLKFSWEEDSHVLVDNARFISRKDV